MKSNKKNIYELLAGAKKDLDALVKKCSSKLPLPRLSASFISQTSNKTKLLKAKYSHQRLRHRVRSSHRPRLLKNLGSLNQHFCLPESLKAYLQKIKRPESLKAYLQKIKRPESPKAYLQKIGGSESFKALLQKIKRLEIPKFSLSQLSVPGNFQKHLNTRVVVASLLVLVFGGLLINANTRVNAFAVEIDGKKIATITEKADAEKLLLNLKAEKARIWKRNVNVRQTLTFESTKAKKYQLDSLVSLKSKLNKNLAFIAVATGIKANGQLTVIVTDNRTAESVLQRLKDSFKLDGLNVTSVDFQEKVELADVPASLNDVLSSEKAVQVLKQGKQRKVTHIVDEGDSLWSIARRYNMHVADLLKINPTIKGEHLNLDQEINLVALEPMINVLITGERTLKENLPYKVVVQTDNSLWRGREKVKTHGRSGSREVTYRIVMKNGSIAGKEVLKEKVLQEATNQVVIRGSKYVVASRGRGGRVGWPISGRITSGYGRRWGSMHTGIDIDGTKGEPVGAAAAGVVISAGWEGGYGKMVVIKHSNGLVTRYGHLSRIEVSVGQSVDRGDLVGLVGSTGHSTGSHLHFEVLNGGSFQNPIRYLK